MRSQLQHEQLLAVSRYSVEQPDTQRQLFLQSLQAFQSELMKFLPCSKYVLIPLFADSKDTFNALYNVENEYILQIKINKLVKLEYCNKCVKYTDEYSNNHMFGIFEIVTTQIFLSGLPEYEYDLYVYAQNKAKGYRLFKGIDNELAVFTDLNDKYTASNIINAKLEEDVEYPPEEDLDVFNEPFINQYGQSVLYGLTFFGIQFIAFNNVQYPSEQFLLSSYMRSGFQEFGIDAISNAQANPGPPIRAHLFTKRRRLAESELDLNQQFLEHEVRDQEHSGLWWAQKLKYLSKIYNTFESEISLTTNNHKFWQSKLDTIKANEDAKMSIDPVGFVSINDSHTNEVLIHCNGYYTSSLAADGNILSGGVSETCLLQNGIETVIDNKIAGYIPFLGMDDPADKYALAIPNMVKVIARSADQIPIGVGGSISATLMQLGNTKKLTKYAFQLLFALQAVCIQTSRSTDPAFDDTQTLQAIANALVEMYKADKSNKPNALQNTIESIVSRPYFKQALNNENFDLLIDTSNEKIELTEPSDANPHIKLWQLTMLLGLKDQSELHTITQIESPPTVELQALLLSNKSWVYGSCISDAFQLQDITNKFKSFDDPAAIPAAPAALFPPATPIKPATVTEIASPEFKSFLKGYDGDPIPFPGLD
ncbi:MAG: hypothetical protein CL678_11860 [Bdellovibrionaceae bacterium]|nr:hypothetical protein [Pseudobdellovibrionaceae bacterium]